MLEKTAAKGVPKIILVMIPLILAAMYYYAAFIDTSAPENTVRDFYGAYFEKDYETVSNNLSVFWGAQMLPQYASLKPQELLNKRAQIESDMAAFLANYGGNAPVPEDLSIEILKKYTKKGEYGAMVAYSFKEAGEEKSLEAAFLVKEDGKFRIYNLVPISRDILPQVANYDIKSLDSQISQLLNEDK